MAVFFPFEVHTPYRLFFSESVEAIVLTLLDGEAAIYANHALFTAPVVPCLLSIKNNKGIWRTAFTAEGLLEVTEHKTILLSDSAEWPEEIDYQRAKAAKERTEATFLNATFKFEKDTASAALRRANMRIRAWEEGQEK